MIMFDDSVPMLLALVAKLKMWFIVMFEGSNPQGNNLPISDVHQPQCVQLCCSGIHQRASPMRRHYSLDGQGYHHGTKVITTVTYPGRRGHRRRTTRRRGGGNHWRGSGGANEGQLSLDMGKELTGHRQQWVSDVGDSDALYWVTPFSRTPDLSPHQRFYNRRLRRMEKVHNENCSHIPWLDMKSVIRTLCPEYTDYLRPGISLRRAAVGFMMASRGELSFALKPQVRSHPWHANKKQIKRIIPLPQPSWPHTTFSLVRTLIFAIYLRLY